ncbi:TetR/AcrR family transcriptional regulator [Kineococcus gynurae]|uniref:TetR/AcrR family transcriptional regulator n=1 Tax=Kineococcus gynurae TaxID=452979 RepID=A0ABV5LRJ7_9ACTN
MTPTASSGRRADIVAAAHRCFAAHGYARASTAQICRAAGVSSGTFFHYFPTKAAVLVAVLEDGLASTRARAEEWRVLAASDAPAALARWREHVLAEAADEHLPGFVAALAGAPDVPEVDAALSEDAALLHDTLVTVLAAGQQQGVVRQDRTADHLARWLGALGGGLVLRAAERGDLPDDLATGLADVVDRMLRP